MKSTIKIGCIGDVVGIPGRIMFQKHVDRIRQEFQLDGLIVNGENSNNNGRGITPRIAKFFKHNGANVITTGNHIWARREIADYMLEYDDLLRPENFPSRAPGSGITTFSCKNNTVGVINLQGQAFMREDLGNPFTTADTALSYLRSKTDIIIVDFHAETTSEKIGLAWYLDGRVSAVVGTHTHVPTADERILPKGTAFITDLGMVGAYNSMLGMKKEPIIERFLTQMPQRFAVEDQGPGWLCGAAITIDTSSGKAIAIERIKVIDTEIALDGSTLEE